MFTMTHMYNIKVINARDDSVKGLIFAVKKWLGAFLYFLLTVRNRSSSSIFWVLLSCREQLVVASRDLVAKDTRRIRLFSSPSMNSKDSIVSVAANIASQPLQNYDSNVWGVLTAISNNARKRRQVLECSVIDSSSKFWFCDLMWF